MKKNFTQRLKKLTEEALRAINDCNAQAILSTGEPAVDNDDAWIVIGRADGIPVLRNKKEQRRIDNGYEKGYFPDEPLSKWEPGDICALADKLLGQ